MSVQRQALVAGSRLRAPKARACMAMRPYSVWACMRVVVGVEWQGSARCESKSAARPGRHLAKGKCGIGKTQARNKAQKKERDYNRIDAPVVLSLISSCPPLSFLFCRFLISCRLFWFFPFTPLPRLCFFTSPHLRIHAYISILSPLRVTFPSTLLPFLSISSLLRSYTSSPAVTSRPVRLSSSKHRHPPPHNNGCHSTIRRTTDRRQRISLVNSILFNLFILQALYSSSTVTFIVIFSSLFSSFVSFRLCASWLPFVLSRRGDRTPPSLNNKLCPSFLPFSAISHCSLHTMPLMP